MDPRPTKTLPRATLKRSAMRDGWVNRLEFLALTHFPRVWRFAQRRPSIERAVNRRLMNRAVERTPARPYRLSTMSAYPSWASLTDKTWNARQLPPTGAGPRVEPSIDAVAALFDRDELVACPKSTVLFAYFAQWFTDGFLRTMRPGDPRQTEESKRGQFRDITRNVSNHEVDLCQLYGMNADETRALRAGYGGRLKSQVIGKAEFPPRLCDDDGKRLKTFDALPEVVGWRQLSVEQRRGLFAMGSDVANSQIGYTMFNVLFLREHNRIAGKLAERYRDEDWDDNQLFETTRSILIVLLIKLAIEEYINHITPYHFQFKFQPESFAKEPWQRPNWECVEFNLLYRWHSLIPESLRIDDVDMELKETTFNNDLLTGRGLGAMFDDASRQRAGKVCLFNTSTWFAERTSKPSVVQSRAVDLASYNAYRELCGYPRVTDVDQISSDSRVRERLRSLYKTVDDIELYVGLFAEDARPNSVLPPLMGRLVGVHAFSQLMTNPLLAPVVYDDETFSKHGMELIASTDSLARVVHRNVRAEPGAPPLVSLRREGWQPE